MRMVHTMASLPHTSEMWCWAVIIQSIAIFNVVQTVKLLRSPGQRVPWKQKCHSEMWGKDLRKRNVLRRWRKIGKEGNDWMSSGKQFQRTDAATGNERRLTVDRRKGVTWSSCVDDDPGWRRPGRSATPTSHSIMAERGHAASETPWQPPCSRPDCSVQRSTDTMTTPYQEHGTSSGRRHSVLAKTSPWYSPQSSCDRLSVYRLSNTVLKHTF